jgi:carbon monoxide dehydrogenase subunit G
MELSNFQHVNAPQQAVWEALNDPEILKSCIAGCESITANQEGGFDVVVSAKVGPVSARFKGKLKLVDAQAPTSYSLVFEGQGGAAGFAKGGADVVLQAENGGTRIQYTAKAQIGGKLAQIGSRLVDNAARKMADDFFGAFEQTLVAAVPTTEPAATGEIMTASVGGAERGGIPYGRILPWLIGLSAAAAAAFSLLR